MQQHLQNHSLYEKYQSAYRVGHSTQTVLIRVTNDILNGVDEGKVVILVLLDL